MNTAPFAISQPLGSQLHAVLAHWRGLCRGEAEIPFWDDLDLQAVKGLCPEVFLLDVFTRPERFRLSAIDVKLAGPDVDRILGRFIDDIELPEPFELLRAQSSATVEELRPTAYVHVPGAADHDPAYRRLLLPAWGEGQVRMLLGAIERG